MWAKIVPDSNLREQQTNDEAETAMTTFLPGLVQIGRQYKLGGWFQITWFKNYEYLTSPAITQIVDFSSLLGSQTKQ